MLHKRVEMNAGLQNVRIPNENACNNTKWKREAHCTLYSMQYHNSRILESYDDYLRWFRETLGINCKYKLSTH